MGVIGMRDRGVKFCKAGLLAAVSLLTFAPAASAEDIHIPPDQARVVTFSAPAKTVFVGNPAIADLTVIDSTHVFLLGKNLGTTNIIALDAAGHEFLDQQVVVIDRPGTMVTVQHGQGQMTLSCSPERCASIVTPGDEKTLTARTDSLVIADQFKTREELASKAASNGNAGSTGGGTGAQQ
jgi:Flp pilus assembly secretin CpaC